MDHSSVKTGVDSLIALLKEHDKLSLSDVAKKLGVSEGGVKQWVDFLVEEKIIGIEYKFTKPFIYLNRDQQTKKSRVIEEETISLSVFKEDFLLRAKKSNIPSAQAEQLWVNHLINQLSIEKHFFLQECRKRQLSSDEALWEEYRAKVLGLCM